MEAAEGIASARPRTTGRPERLEDPDGWRAHALGTVLLQNPMNKPLEKPGDDGDLLAYDSRDVI